MSVSLTRGSEVVIETELEEVIPKLSVAEAVMVWGPEVGKVVERV